jgi:hypothetical protein
MGKSSAYSLPFSLIDLPIYLPFYILFMTVYTYIAKVEQTAAGAICGVLGAHQHFPFLAALVGLQY